MRISAGDIETYEESGIVIPESNRLDFTVERLVPSVDEEIVAAVAKLQRAMNDRDLDAYASILDERFWFTESDCDRDLLYFNGLEEEIEILGGEGDGSDDGLFDIFTTFEAEFEIRERITESAGDFPDSFSGDPDGHPAEDWQVVVAQIRFLMVDANADGFRIDQNVRLKFRLEEDGLSDGPGEWKLARWIDEPLAGCSASKLAVAPKAGVENLSWGWIKFAFVPSKPPEEPPEDPPEDPPADDFLTTFPGQFITGVTAEFSTVSSAVGPGQDLVFRFFGQGMTDVKQLEFKVDIDPPEFFDITQSSFVPETPFFTIENGILVSEPGLICLGAASLGDDVDGDSLLGTLTLHTAVEASPDRGASIQIRSLSIGPNSDVRDQFPRSELGMCVAVNGGSETGCR